MKFTLDHLSADKFAHGIAAWLCRKPAMLEHDPQNTNSTDRRVQTGDEADAIIASGSADDPTVPSGDPAGWNVKGA